MFGRASQAVVKREPRWWKDKLVIFLQKNGIRLFVLPPRSPKLNGGVERAHRTHTEEFYEVTDGSFELAELHHDLLEWETVYNTIRPHQASGYLTPLEFIQQNERIRVSLIT